jgi:hypothetical protein
MNVRKLSEIRNYELGVQVRDVGAALHLCAVHVGVEQAVVPEGS